MKKTELIKSIITDVIASSGGDITDTYFEKLRALFGEYETQLLLEEDEENA